MKSLLRHSVAIGGLVLAGCTLPADAGHEFRARLQSSEGQPVQALFDELGPQNPTEHNGRRVYGWGRMVVSNYPSDRDCDIEVTADQAGRIVTGTMTGSDHACGDFVLALRRTESRYRRHPGLREREAEESRRMLDALVSLRQSLNKPDPE